jgi:alanine racemase
LALRAVAEVNLAAIERNAKLLLNTIGRQTKLCAVVKADGYGHGAAPAARAALAAGASSLAVATAQEAADLRHGGLDSPILVLGAISEEELPVAVAADAVLCAWDPGFVEQLRLAAIDSGRELRVHVKLDTGLGRLGTRVVGQALAVADAVRAAAPALRLTGAMTHFATADGDLDFANHQLAQFKPFVAELRTQPGGQELTVHAANSAGTLRLPDARFDMVRTGIALYGCDPINANPADHGLEPALTLRSYVAAVKPIAPGESTGYGRHFIAEQETTIATLPIGYGDGIPPRALANNCDVLINGRRHPLCGMVSMDNITVNVGLVTDVAVGDRGTIIGVDGAHRQTAEDLAARIGTINYEVLCWISRRVPRIYHRDGEPVAARMPQDLRTGPLASLRRV